MIRELKPVFWLGVDGVAGAGEAGSSDEVCCSENPDGMPA